MLKLADKYSKERLEKACQRASNCKLYSYASVKSILENNLDSQCLEVLDKGKIVPMPRPRFARDPADYKSSYTAQETFDEKMRRLHPTSEHGNAMIGCFEGLMADQIIEEEKQCRK
jgi:hypothetical protein